MIAQHQTEPAMRPSITTFTTKWAPQNIDQSDSSPPGAARPLAITSVGFIGTGPFVLRRTSAQRATPGHETRGLMRPRVSRPGIRRNKGRGVWRPRARVGHKELRGR